MTTDFGIAVACTDALKTGRYVSGLRVLAESIYRRLITRKGELIQDPEYGFPIADYLGSTTSPAEIARLPGLIRQAFASDERIEAIDTNVTETDLGGGEVAWDIALDVFSGLGPFRLVVRVSDVTVELLEFSEAA